MLGQETEEEGREAEVQRKMVGVRGGGERRNEPKECAELGMVNEL